MCDIAEQNVERLLTRAYRPEQPDPAFAAKVAGLLAAHARPQPAAPPWRPVLAAATIAAGVALAVLLWPRMVPVSIPTADDIASNIPPSPGLTPQRRPDQTKVTALALGDTATTGPDERRRVRCPDNTVLLLNRNTSATLTADRRVTLARGELFAEVAPLPAGSAGATFTVLAPGRTVEARGTKFAVRAAATTSAVLVTQGTVHVGGASRDLKSGDELPAGATAPRKAGGAAGQLDWTRELMAASQSPLVPASDRAGGQLVALDPDGQEAKLELRRYHLDVHVEDGFARTTIDQTYFNYTPGRLEGTFYFPLPQDASLSRLAMYVDGVRMEGGMAERDHARNVFETIVYQRRDPALLEWVDGSTFKMRVFPLEGRQEKRIVLSYTQRLPSVDQRLTYRFPAGHSLGVVRNWSVNARVVRGGGWGWTTPNHQLDSRMEGADLVMQQSREGVKLDRDFVLELDQLPAAPATRLSQFTSDGNRYLMLRHRPALQLTANRQRRDWVFLVETSADRNPLLARAQIEVVRGLLEHAEHDDTFRVLTAGTRPRWLADAALRATAENVATAMDWLSGTHLIGALDLEAAFAVAGPALLGLSDPWLVHVGSGTPAQGETDAGKLVAALQSGAKYVGVGVGQRVNRGLMRQAAERSGGFAVTVNPDENIPWRAFALANTLNTPRLQAAHVSDGSDRPYLLFDTALAQGEELCAVTRLGDDGKLPATLTVRGRVGDLPYQAEVPVETVADGAGHLPRTWAKLEIDRLLALDPIKHKNEIVERSKAMYVMTPFTSLLVLESEAMYEQYKVDRGRKDHWAMYACPEKVSVGADPLPVVIGPNLQSPGEVLGGLVTRQWVCPLSELIAVAEGKVGKGKDALATWRFSNGPQAFGWGENGRLGDTEVYFLQAGLDAAGGRLTTEFNSINLNDGMSERAELLGKLTKAGAGRLTLADGELSKSLADPEDRRKQVTVTGGTVNRGLLRGTDGAVAKRKMLFLQQAGRAFDADADAGPVDELNVRRLLESAKAKGDRRSQLGLEESFGVNFATDGPVSVDNLTRTMNGGTVDLFDGTSMDVAHTFDKRGFVGRSNAHRLGRVVAHGGNGDLRYRPPHFTNDGRVFSDLLAYAPGMNTLPADVAAVLERDTLEGRTPRGDIAPAARALIDAARRRGWERVRRGTAGPTLTLDGQGRFCTDRAAREGLIEQVVCDGETLWHLYPEIGVGAKRPVSRFHRAAVADAVPWFVPPADDLAAGYNLRAGDDRTVIQEPVGDAPLWRCEWRFDAAGNLVSRVWRQLRESKRDAKGEPTLEVLTATPVLARIDIRGGEVVYGGRDGEKPTTVTYERSPADAPTVVPVTDNLVVVPLPFVTYAEAKRRLGSRDGIAWRDLTTAELRPLFTASAAAGDHKTALQIYREALEPRGERRIGYFTLLAAAGANLDGDNGNVLGSLPGDPLAEYLAMATSPVLQKHALGLIRLDAKGFLGRLVQFRTLLHRWERLATAPGNTTPAGVEAEAWGQVMAFAEADPRSLLGYALLDETFRRLRRGRVGPEGLQEIALLRKYADVPALHYHARYSAASRLVWRESPDAAKEFASLVRDTLAAGTVPPFDGDLLHGMRLGGPDGFPALMRESAATLATAGDRGAVVHVAEQVRQVGDDALADHLHAVAIDATKGDEERLAVTLRVVALLKSQGNAARAADRLQPLLEREPFNKLAGLWRLASELAAERGQVPQAIAALERALDREHEDGAAVVNLQAVRADYGKLLDHYAEVAKGVAALGVTAPATFPARVVRAADRWRALDPEPQAVCDKAAAVLEALGSADLAWDYLTTPLATYPGEAGPWADLAKRLAQRGEGDLADRAYAAACRANATDAQLLWDRTQLLRQRQNYAEARPLLQKLATGEWQPRFAWLQAEAKRQLGE